MRGSRDFNTVDDYADFVQQLLERRNRLVKGKLEQEIPYLGPLPPAPLPESPNYRSRVRRGCTIQADNLVYGRVRSNADGSRWEYRKWRW